MQLCEVVRTEATPQAVVDTAYKFVLAQGKTPVLCKDTPGFIVNRLLVPYMAQAIALVDRGDASVKGTLLLASCGNDACADRGSPKREA